MPYFTDTTQAATYDALLIKSNRIYREIESVYRRMTEDLSGSKPENVIETKASLDMLFKNALTIDSMIAEWSARRPALTATTEKLLAQRSALLKSLYQTNRHLTRTTENVRALLRHEISTMSTNQSVLKSYKPANTERSSMIRGAF